MSRGTGEAAPRAFAEQRGPSAPWQGGRPGSPSGEEARTGRAFRACVESGRHQPWRGESDGARMRHILLPWESKRLKRAEECHASNGLDRTQKWPSPADRMGQAKGAGLWLPNPAAPCPLVPPHTSSSRGGLVPTGRLPHPPETPAPSGPGSGPSGPRVGHCLSPLHSQRPGHSASCHLEINTDAVESIS